MKRGYIMENKILNVDEIIDDIKMYEMYEVVDDFKMNDTLSVSVFFEDNKVIVYLVQNNDGVIYNGSSTVDFSDFENYQQEDFDNFIGQILMYCMQEIEG